SLLVPGCRPSVCPGRWRFRCLSCPASVALAGGRSMALDIHPGYPYEHQRVRFRMAFGPNNIVFGFIPAYFLNQLDFISIAAGLDLFGLRSFAGAASRGL